METKTVSFRGVHMTRFEDGSWELDGIDPVDPTEDLGATARFVLWAIGVILWVVGKVSSRKVREKIAREVLAEYVNA